MDNGAHRQPTALLIGTGHWANPGLDYRSAEQDRRFMLQITSDRSHPPCLLDVLAR